MQTISKPHGVAEFADNYLNSPLGQKIIQSVASSTSGLHTLSVTKIRNIVCSMPPTAEQEAIVEIVDELLTQCHSSELVVEAALARSKRLRQSILKRAFEGKLVAQNPNDKPATDLLTRIRTQREAEKPRKSAKRKFTR